MILQSFFGLMKMLETNSLSSVSETGSMILHFKNYQSPNFFILSSEYYLWP